MEKYLSLRAETGEQGKVQAVFSTFDVVDSDGDVVRQSAFRNGQEIPMVWSHDWNRPIGKGRVKTDATRAVFDGQFFMDTQDGKEAFRTVKAMGDLQEWSWGFRILDSEYGEQDGKNVQFINKAEVFEVSPVLVGANRQTATLGIKDGLNTYTPLPASDYGSVTTTGTMGVGWIYGEVAEIKEGRRNSASDLERLRAILATVQELIGDMEMEMDSDAGKQAADWDIEQAGLDAVLAAERLMVDIT